MPDHGHTEKGTFKKTEKMTFKIIIVIVIVINSRRTPSKKKKKNLCDWNQFKLRQKKQISGTSRGFPPEKQHEQNRCLQVALGLHWIFITLPGELTFTRQWKTHHMKNVKMYESYCLKMWDFPGIRHVVVNSRGFSHIPQDRKNCRKNDHQQWPARLDPGICQIVRSQEGRDSTELSVVKPSKNPTKI